MKKPYSFARKGPLPFYARITACTIECPGCGRVYRLRSRIPTANWTPLTQRLSCSTCKQQFTLGMIAWQAPVGKAGRGMRNDIPMDVIPPATRKLGIARFAERARELELAQIPELPQLAMPRPSAPGLGLLTPVRRRRWGPANLQLEPEFGVYKGAQTSGENPDPNQGIGSPDEPRRPGFRAMCEGCGKPIWAFQRAAQSDDGMRHEQCVNV